jgi:hypothetical protein
MKTIVFWLIAHWPLFRKWFGDGTPDDFRNPFWRLFEGPLAVKVLWALTFLDLRIFYHRSDGRYVLIDLFLPYRTRQNFWNAFFSVQLYLVVWRYFAWPKINIVFRPLRDYYLEASTPGVLFDSGAIHAKFAIFNWQREQIEGQGGDAWAWEEGSV